MNSIAIRVEGLGKQYHIGGSQERYTTLRDRLADTLSAPIRRAGKLLRGQATGAAELDTTIWALKDVSFEVKCGEVVGIIGRNGAGKTTLLKILSRITEPTEGHADVFGRVGSLLEVGTGFHPELTGRENVYLNGAILGMRRAEIERKFDEIVTFSEIGQFIDTPVKHYSSGMYVRLAFAVAAHLEPEILLVDEVLAVGDVAFQRKCLGKMRDVARVGRTVLFVSHNMPAIQRLCGRACLIEGGNLIEDGHTSEVVDLYYKLMNPDTDGKLSDKRPAPDGSVRFRDWFVSSDAAPVADTDEHRCHTGDACTMTFLLEASRVVRRASFGVALWSDNGVLIWAMRNLDHGGEHEYLEEGLYEIAFTIPQFPVKPGAYQIQVSANEASEGALDEWYPKAKLIVLPRDESGIPERWQGVLGVRGEFTLRTRA